MDIAYPSKCIMMIVIRNFDASLNSLVLKGTELTP